MASYSDVNTNVPTRRHYYDTRHSMNTRSSLKHAIVVATGVIVYLILTVAAATDRRNRLQRSVVIICHLLRQIRPTCRQSTSCRVAVDKQRWRGT